MNKYSKFLVLKVNGFITARFHYRPVSLPLAGGLKKFRCMGWNSNSHCHPHCQWLLIHWESSAGHKVLDLLSHQHRFSLRLGQSEVFRVCRFPLKDLLQPLARVLSVGPPGPLVAAPSGVQQWLTWCGSRSVESRRWRSEWHASFISTNKKAAHAHASFISTTAAWSGN